MNEHIGTNYSFSTRKRDHKSLGAWEKYSSTTCATSTDYSISVPGSFQPSHSRRVKHIPPNRPIMAGSLSFFPIIRFRERCSSSRTLSKDFSEESYGNCKCYFAYETFRRNSLEYSQHGKNTGCQRCQRQAYMEAAQSETSSDQNVQTQPGQAVHRETSRYCWSLYEPARQSNCLLRRRKEPNSSVGTYSTIITHAARYSSPANTRLYASWHDNVICCLKYARWYCDRGLYAAPQTPGVHQISTNYQYKNSARFSPSFNCRQLWDAQTSTCSIMAQTASSFPATFYTNVQFLAKYGRTLVRRNNVKTNSSGFVQKR